MSEISRRRSIFTVTNGGVERTVTVETGIYIPSSDEASVTLPYTMGARPIQCGIVALDRSQCSDGNTNYVYSINGSGQLNSSKYPDAAWRAAGTSGNGSGSAYCMEIENNTVKFISASNGSAPFRSGIEYVYELMWVS